MDRRDTGKRWDEAAFAELVDRYQPPLLRMCYVMLQDRALAEDAVQETFFKAYRAAGSFRAESSEKTWLMRIAMNVCRDMQRRGWFRFVDRRVTPEMLPEPDAACESDEDLLLTLMALPYQDKQVLLLYYYQDMTLAEMAKALHLAVSTVSARLNRAKRRLKAAWKEESGDA